MCANAKLVVAAALHNRGDNSARPRCANGTLGGQRLGPGISYRATTRYHSRQLTGAKSSGAHRNAKSRGPQCAPARWGAGSLHGRVERTVSCWEQTIGDCADRYTFVALPSAIFSSIFTRQPSRIADSGAEQSIDPRTHASCRKQTARHTLGRNVPSHGSCRVCFAFDPPTEGGHAPITRH